MKKNIKKILIFTTTSILATVLLAWAFVAIKNNDEMLLSFSEFREIQSNMMAYHLDYGRYPITDNDILIKEYILCDSNFIKKDQKCNHITWDPKNLTLDFIYKKNTDGVSYSIEFKTEEDNRYLNCIHKANENKKGCNYVYNLRDGLSVEK